MVTPAVLPMFGLLGIKKKKTPSAVISPNKTGCPSQVSKLKPHPGSECPTLTRDAGKGILLLCP